MTANKQLYLFILAVMICACSKVETPEELRAFISNPDHGLTKIKDANSIRIQVTYQPTDLLVIQSLSDNPSPYEVDSLRQEFSKYDYFLLSLSSAGKEVETYDLEKSGMSQRIQTFAFGLGDYVQIVANQNDTIPLSDHVYQRTYGAGQSSDFLMVFEADKLRNSSEFKLQINDLGLGLGIQNFTFKTEKMNTIPRLKTSDLLK